MSNTAQPKETTPKLQYVSPDDLEFDPENPRFAGEVAGKSQEDIQQYLFQEPHRASELVDSLVENGFIDYEPLVVKRKGGKFVVVEGNRRLAAIREIRTHSDRYEGRKSDLESIPVLVFPDRPDEQQQNEMRVYLGVRHLLGFREWPPISKAEFLERECQRQGGLDRIIREVRLTKTEVRRFLVPYRLLRSAGAVLPPGEDFWVLGEALNRAGIKKYLQLEVDPKTLEIKSFEKRNLKLLLEDLYGARKAGSKERDASTKVIGDTRELARLARVLGSEIATLVLHKTKRLGEAEIYVDTREESFKRLQKITKDLAVIVRKVLPRTKDVESQRLKQSVRQLESAVRAFLNKHA